MTLRLKVMLRGENPGDGTPFVALNFSGNSIQLGGIVFVSTIRDFSKGPIHAARLVRFVLNRLTFQQQDTVRDIAEQQGNLSVLLPEDCAREVREAVLGVIDEWLEAMSIKKFPVPGEAYWSIYANVVCPVS